MMMDQSVLNRAVNIATRSALNGTPVAYIQWIPPKTAASDPAGSFAIEYAQPFSGSQRPSWEL